MLGLFFYVVFLPPPLSLSLSVYCNAYNYTCYMCFTYFVSYPPMLVVFGFSNRNTI